MAACWFEGRYSPHNPDDGLYSAVDHRDEKRLAVSVTQPVDPQDTESSDPCSSRISMFFDPAQWFVASGTELVEPLGKNPRNEF